MTSSCISSLVAEGTGNFFGKDPNFDIAPSTSGDGWSGAGKNRSGAGLVGDNLTSFGGDLPLDPRGVPGILIGDFVPAEPRGVFKKPSGLRLWPTLLCLPCTERLTFIIRLTVLYLH